MGLVEKLKKEFDIEEEWLSFEIHPETPAEGVLLTEHLPHIDWEEMYAGLRQSGKEYNITFGDVTLLANSRKAFEASEFARDQGKYHAFHEGLFYAYFTDVRNIGDPDVILDVAEKTGLDTVRLKAALDGGKYLPVLEQVTRQARQLGFSGVPAFVINGQYSIVGVQPIDVFRQAIIKSSG